MKLFAIFAFFMLGIVVGILFITYMPKSPLEIPLSSENKQSDIMLKDRIQDSSIQVYTDKIVINLEDLKGRKISWSSYADTNSMVPTLDRGCNGLEFVPESTQDMHEGDIIAFTKNNALIIHRIQKIGADKEGWFAITKGDNNSFNDGKVRWPEIKYVTFGIIC